MKSLTPPAPLGNPPGNDSSPPGIGEIPHTSGKAAAAIVEAVSIGYPEFHTFFVIHRPLFYVIFNHLVSIGNALSRAIDGAFVAVRAHGLNADVHRAVDGQRQIRGDGSKPNP